MDIGPRRDSHWGSICSLQQRFLIPEAAFEPAWTGHQSSHRAGPPLLLVWCACRRRRSNRRVQLLLPGGAHRRTSGHRVSARNRARHPCRRPTRARHGNGSHHTRLGPGSGGLVVWLGALGYLLYQAVMFCFATPVNTLFLFYIAYLGLAVWSIVLLLRATDLNGYRTRISPRLPARFIAAFGLTLAALNAYVWLAQIVPAVFSSEPSTLVQDFAAGVRIEAS